MIIYLIYLLVLEFFVTVGTPSLAGFGDAIEEEAINQIAGGLTINKSVFSSYKTATVTVYISATASDMQNLVAVSTNLENLNNTQAFAAGHAIVWKDSQGNPIDGNPKSVGIYSFDLDEENITALLTGSGLTISGWGSSSAIIFKISDVVISGEAADVVDYGTQITNYTQQGTDYIFAPSALTSIVSEGPVQLTVLGDCVPNQWYGGIAWAYDGTNNNWPSIASPWANLAGCSIEVDSGRGIVTCIVTKAAYETVVSSPSVRFSAGQNFTVSSIWIKPVAQ